MALVATACGDGDRETTAPTAPTAPPPTAVVSSGTQPEGFDLVAARVTAADGEVCDLCVWLADTPDARARGLMGVTDLGPAQAMAFLYPSATTTSFWMYNTPMPLSIAYFDAAGVHLDSYDMQPCAANPCTSYPTAPRFTIAVEVPQGGLPDLLVAPGSTFELLAAPCGEPARDPTRPPG